MANIWKGTSLLLQPGIVTGGSVTHECPLSRSVGYFLEPIITIAPFSKKPLNLTLKGVTTDGKDLSVSLLVYWPKEQTSNFGHSCF